MFGLTHQEVFQGGVMVVVKTYKYPSFALFSLTNKCRSQQAADEDTPYTWRYEMSRNCSDKCRQLAWFLFLASMNAAIVGI